MRYEDAISMQTPEGVTIELTLAGVGSRFVAAIIDHALQLAIVIAILVSVGLTQNVVAFAVGTVFTFVTFFAYDIIFETRASGRTPGKRLTGLRVVKTDGRPVDFRASAVRNLMRLIDILPGAYLVAIVSVFLTKKNQRLGDLAAGTLVMRERVGENSGVSFRARTALDPSVEHWDVSALTPADVAAVRQFLERRHALTADARKRLAVTLAKRLHPAVVGPPDEVAPEWFLEQLLAVKMARSS
jgi:uncharacterized RDD family membrane protein YckC